MLWIWVRVGYYLKMWHHSWGYSDSRLLWVAQVEKTERDSCCGWVIEYELMRWWGRAFRTGPQATVGEVWTQPRLGPGSGVRVNGSKISHLVGVHGYRGNDRTLLSTGLSRGTTRPDNTRASFLRVQGQAGPASFSLSPFFFAAGSSKGQLIHKGQSH